MYGVGTREEGDGWCSERGVTRDDDGRGRVFFVLIALIIYMYIRNRRIYREYRSSPSPQCALRVSVCRFALVGSLVGIRGWGLGFGVGFAVGFRTEDWIGWRV